MVLNFHSVRFRAGQPSFLLRVPVVILPAVKAQVTFLVTGVSIPKGSMRRRVKKRCQQKKGMTPFNWITGSPINIDDQRRCDVDNLRRSVAFSSTAANRLQSTSQAILPYHSHLNHGISAFASWIDSNPSLDRLNPLLTLSKPSRPPSRPAQPSTPCATEAT
ncbi:hypothetical protein B0H65DRAFT_54505 [Neurospora tetraspora]|uniref:Uncharacterized protein n=1 Tax=Neurospora tetraspora TaxID=94610 RepID=A0AAE0JQM5_9PEZI|nr:hypothetical protein B0H65DRAFT_54505 [Neurospora tetraspora]